MRSRYVVIGSGLLFAIASSVPAYAQSAGGGALAYPAACAASSVQPTSSEKAHAMYQAGKVQYDDANYDAAITQFLDAYTRDCSKHDLLVIISRAFELKGDRAEAIRALELYLEREKPVDASTHRTRIENLRAKLVASPPPSPSPSPSSTVAGPVDVREHTLPPWIVVGVGGAAVLTGAILLALAPNVPPSCDEDTGLCAEQKDGQPLSKVDVQENESTAERSVNMRRGGLITLLLGGGFVAGGLLWHFLEPTGPAPAAGSIKPKVIPQLAPGYAGMSFGGRF